MAKGIAAKVGKPAKVDNNERATAAKLEIRRNVLEAIGAERAHVFDAFAGEGHMHDAVWCEAASYTGCDQRFFRDARRCFVADNVRVLRSIDLRPFNVFDLDAYGSPWEQAVIIAERRPVQPGELVGIVITEGQGLKMKMGGMSYALAQVAGLKQRLHGLGRNQDTVIDRAIARLPGLMGCTTVDRWQAIGKSGSRMIYVGLVLRGVE